MEDVKSLWGEFNDLKINTPKEILEQQAKYLPKLTRDILYAEVKDLQDLELFDTFEYLLDDDANEFNGFAYKFLLKSTFMDKYQFEVLRLHHGIDIYPVYIHVDADTKKEINLTSRYMEVTSEEEFINFLSKVLKSDRIRNVIGAIIKLSK